MGMFDYVECPPELLPDGFKPEHLGFQTKAFEWPMMRQYRITPEGRLELKMWDHVKTGRWFRYDADLQVVYVDPPIEPPSMKTVTSPDGKDSMTFKDGPYEEDERQNHRWVEYVNRDGSHLTGSFYFDDYIATFADGQLTEIILNKDWSKRVYHELEKGDGLEKRICPNCDKELAPSGWCDKCHQYGEGSWDCG